MARGLLVTGTSSSAGKSTLVAGICRMLADEGMRVAPFKGQNMALNSYVTAQGEEIARAQAAQAAAARVEPEAAMNPVLLKPTSERSSAVVVMGAETEMLGAMDYQARKADLVPVVDKAFKSLSERFDAVICEGAGSASEINLLENDLVNLGFAARAGIGSILVGDIDRGGVFASLYGTKKILPPELGSRIRAFAINRFRGDRALLDPGLHHLVELTNTPVVGVLPYLGGLVGESEDSLSLADLFSTGGSREGSLRCGVVKLPFISNFTDFEALVAEDDLDLRLIDSPEGVEWADLLIIPGTKATVSDLAWMRERNIAGAIVSHHRAGGGVMGICGGYQMLTEEIEDLIESRSGSVPGLGLVPGRTIFRRPKHLAQLEGELKAGAGAVTARGYQIHFGRVKTDGPALLERARTFDGEVSDEGFWDGQVMGTTMHGIFDSDGAREEILGRFAQGAGRSFTRSVSFAQRREDYFERCAELVREHIGTDVIRRLAGI